MQDLRIDNNQVDLLNKLIGHSFTIIWDINAFYFNTPITTYKLECLDEKPVGSDYRYDEIFYCDFSKLEERIEFEENNPKYWYKIIDKNASINSIDIIDLIQEFPKDELLNSEEEAENRTGVNKLTIGLIVKTEKGRIPAFLLPSNHGFQWQEKYGYYEKEEIGLLIKQELGKYQIRTVPNN